MFEVKDVKSIKIVPFTLMSSSISAILAFIYAIFILIILGIMGALVPGINGGIIATLGIGVILLLPSGFFVLNIVQSFLTALLYNMLVPRLGSIKLGFEDLTEIKNIPVVPFALMLAAIGGIITFIAMLIIGPIIAISLQATALAASMAGTAVPDISSIGALGVIGLLIMVIGIPIAIFIGTFISTAIIAVIYNYLAPKIGGIQFNFGNAIGNIFEIESIPVIPFALITAIVLTIFNLIVRVIAFIIAVVSGSTLTEQLINLVLGVVVYLIIGFIVYAITAFLYNYLRPKIGGIKLEIE